MSYTHKTVILIVGQPGAGKTTVCKYLEVRHNFTVVRVSDLIREYAEKNNMPLTTRQDYIDTHAMLLMDAGKHIIPSRILHTPSPRICVDGIRVPAHIRELQREGAVAIGLECPGPIRFRRAMRRKRSLDKPVFKSFMHDEEQEGTNTDPFVQNTRHALTMTDYTIETNDVLDTIYRRLDAVLQSLRTDGNPPK